MVESEKSANEKSGAESKLYLHKIATLKDTITKNIAEIEELQNAYKNT